MSDILLNMANIFYHLNDSSHSDSSLCKFFRTKLLDITFSICLCRETDFGDIIHNLTCLRDSWDNSGCITHRHHLKETFPMGIILSISFSHQSAEGNLFHFGNWHNYSDDTCRFCMESCRECNHFDWASWLFLQGIISGNGTGIKCTLFNILDMLMNSSSEYSLNYT